MGNHHSWCMVSESTDGILSVLPICKLISADDCGKECLEFPANLDSTILLQRFDASTRLPRLKQGTLNASQLMRFYGECSFVFRFLRQLQGSFQPELQGGAKLYEMPCIDLRHDMATNLQKSFQLPKIPHHFKLYLTVETWWSAWHIRFDVLFKHVHGISQIAHTNTKCVILFCELNFFYVNAPSET